MKALISKCNHRCKPVECSTAVKIAIIVAIALFNIVGVAVAVCVYKHNRDRAE